MLSIYDSKCLSFNFFIVLFKKTFKTVEYYAEFFSLLRFLFSSVCLLCKLPPPTSQQVHNNLQQGVILLHNYPLKSIENPPYLAGHFLRIRQWGGGASTKRDHTIPSVEK